MSRIGKQPIAVPGGVTVQITADEINVSGPKGQLNQPMLSGLDIKQEGDQITVSRQDDLAQTRARHGLMRSLLANMVQGVSQGFERKLEINGVGYRASVQGAELKMSLGFSHEVKYQIPTGIGVAVDQNIITVTGFDKQLVGQVSAEIRALKKPEPYKGKGIKYVEERIIRKSGKSGKEAA